MRKDGQACIAITDGAMIFHKARLCVGGGRSPVSASPRDVDGRETDCWFIKRVLVFLREVVSSLGVLWEVLSSLGLASNLPEEIIDEIEC